MSAVCVLVSVLSVKVYDEDCYVDRRLGRVVKLSEVVVYQDVINDYSSEMIMDV